MAQAQPKTQQAHQTQQVKKSAPPSDGDFPSLAGSGEKGKGGGAWGSEKRFADLARSWGVQQKETEEERKRLMKQRVTEDMLRQEREEKDRAFYHIGLAKATQLIYRDNRGDEEAGLYDLGGAKPVDKDAVELDDSDMYVPPEEETGDNWNAPRKSRYDLY
jgi:hypothetical protein